MDIVYRARECGGIQRGIVFYSSDSSGRGACALSYPDGEWTVWMYLWHLFWEGGETRAEKREWHARDKLNL